MPVPYPPPPKVDLIGWTGDAGQLAARLRLPEAELIAKLKALARDSEGKRRLVIEATPANAAPIFSALARLLGLEAS